MCMGTIITTPRERASRGSEEKRSARARQHRKIREVRALIAKYCQARTRPRACILAPDRLYCIHPNKLHFVPLLACAESKKGIGLGVRYKWSVLHCAWAFSLMDFMLIITIIVNRWMLNRLRTLFSGSKLIHIHSTWKLPVFIIFGNFSWSSRFWSKTSIIIIVSLFSQEFTSSTAEPFCFVMLRLNFR